MAETALTTLKDRRRGTGGWQGIAADWSSDQRAFKNVSWGKAMMWIFLLSDTFVFSCFLLSLHDGANVDDRAVAESERGLRAARSAGQHIPLILIAIMTFVLISSSGTMAMAVNFGYRRDRAKTAALMLVTAALRRDVRRHAGVRMDQADHGGRAALGKSVGRGAVRLHLLHDHGLPRHPRHDRRDFPDRHRAQGLAGRLRRREARLLHEPEGATTRSSKSWASTGTSSISCGFSSLPSSIFGEVGA